jgi:arginyl-tRNA--protein-N-Asp/Glu arginylyltransferase
MRTDDYEELMRLGWSRCGQYFYMRDVVKSCCECYSYRVDAQNFELQSQQEKALKRFHRYLETGSKNPDFQISNQKPSPEVIK